VEGTVREVKRRVRVVASSYRAIDRSVDKIFRLGSNSSREQLDAEY